MKKWQVEVLHANGISYGFEIGSVRKLGKLIQQEHGEVKEIHMNNISVEIDGELFRGTAFTENKSA